LDQQSNSKDNQRQTEPKSRPGIGAHPTFVLSQEKKRKAPHVKKHNTHERATTRKGVKNTKKNTKNKNDRLKTHTSIRPQTFSKHQNTPKTSKTVPPTININLEKPCMEVLEMQGKSKQQPKTARPEENDNTPPFAEVRRNNRPGIKTRRGCGKGGERPVPLQSNKNNRPKPKKGQKNHRAFPSHREKGKSAGRTGGA